MNDENNLRPCKVVDYYGKFTNALFHKFDNDGDAIVEYEDGSVHICEANDVIFLDKKFQDYSFESKQM